MSNGQKFENNSNDVAKTIERSGSKLLESLARETRAEVVKVLLRGARSGKVYKVPGTKVSYRASSPGQAPARRTGDLANSYAVRIPSEKSSEVYSSLPQAMLEFGTRNIKPRPHLRPSSDIVMVKIKSIVKRSFK